jgi:hypothetical protein
MPSSVGPDPFITGLAGNVLRQSGENYFQRGQAFMQSRMGFLSSGALHYYYNVNSEYGAPLTGGGLPSRNLLPSISLGRSRCLSVQHSITMQTGK